MFARMLVAVVVAGIVANVAFAGPSADARKRERLLARLEAARKAALDAIFDESTYRNEDHGRSGQANVDEKVEAVRAAWGPVLTLLAQDAVKVEKLPAAKRSAFLASAAEGWEAAVRQHVLDRATLRKNETLRGATDLEREQVRLTNEYRIVMGRPALELEERLVRCAREHSAEMTRLNYFAHESPTKERKTPSDRARLAGVTGAVGENIAKGYDSPARAHDGWLHSAGHHRNILREGWHRMGAGKDGSHWTQNYAD